MARRKTPYLVVTFPTTTAAFALQTAARRVGLRGRLAPIPRQLSASCGFAWREPAAGGDALRQLLEDGGLVFEELIALEL